MQTNYPVYLESDDDFQSFGVVVPDLPGCVSDGDSVEDALKLAKEAIEFHLESMIEEGDSIQAPKPIVAHLREKSDWFENPGLWALVSIAMPPQAQAA